MHAAVRHLMDTPKNCCCCGQGRICPTHGDTTPHERMDDNQFSEAVEATNSPAAKRIAELERENARLLEDCLRMARALGIECQYLDILPNVQGHGPAPEGDNDGK